MVQSKFGKYTAQMLALLVLLSVLLSGCGRKAEVSDFLTVTFSGLNGRGECEVTLDIDTMTAEAFGKNEMELTSWEDMNNYMVQYNTLSKCVTVEVVQEENLSNGDHVTVIVKCEGEAEKHFKSAEKKYTVEGLKESKTVDPFDFLEISYDGVSGFADIRLINISDDEILSDIRFSAEDSYRLSSGDEIEITASLSEYAAEQGGYILSETLKKVTVPELDYYITDASLITKDVIQGIVDHFSPKYTYESNDTWAYDVPEYCGGYFAEKVDNLYSVNDLVIYLSYHIWPVSDKENVRTEYVCIDYSDIIASPDGELKFEYEDAMDFNDIFFDGLETLFAELDEKENYIWCELSY